jgi:hypothetical protein
METQMFLTKCAEDPHLDRSMLFQRLKAQSDIYPYINQHPLVEVLSQEEWPPETMKNDESIPKEIYEDDGKLLYH